MSALVLAAAPALPLHAAGKYVAGAYIVFLALVLVYVAIMARRLSRTERELGELRREAQALVDATPDESEREKERVA
jgi:membrane protein implicated in regulation of membrane protease activity